MLLTNAKALVIIRKIKKLQKIKEGIIIIIIGKVDLGVKTNQNRKKQLQSIIIQARRAERLK